MKTLFTIVLLLTSSGLALATAFTSTQSGLFSAGTTWVGGVAPAASGDTFNIAAGHVVTYDVNDRTKAWGVSTNNGELRFTNGIPCSLKMAGNLSGLGVWSALNIDFTASNTPAAVVEFTNGAQCTMTGTNNIQWTGVTNHQGFAVTTAVALANTNCVTVNSLPSGIRTNDVMAVVNAGSASQNSTFYVVSAITNNTVYFKTNTLFGSETNEYPGIAFTSTIPSLYPTNCAVTFLSCPIAIRQTVQAAISVFTASQTNTLTGVMVNNTGLGVFNSCRGLNLYGCSANGNNSGGFACNSCTVGTITGCSANGNNVGGFACSYCTVGTITGCSANGNNSGGFACYSCTVGTITGCYANGNNSGGFACNSCTVGTITGCSANGNSSGGFAYNSCTVGTITGCVNSDSEALIISCFGCLFVNTSSVGDTFSWPAGFQSLPYQYDTKTWIFNTGSVRLTNNIYSFTFTSTNWPIYLTENIGLNAKATKTVSVNVLLTNGVSYAVSFGSLSQTNITGSGAWTNLVLSVQNTNAYPVQTTLTVSATATNIANVGNSTVQIGNDERLLIY